MIKTVEEGLEVFKKELKRFRRLEKKLFKTRHSRASLDEISDAAIERGRCKGRVDTMKEVLKLSEKEVKEISLKI